MPYNIWCDGCQLHVGMGVRFNAEKTKIGMYYTTPVYQFRMKCTGCPNKYVIKTDPANMVQLSYTDIPELRTVAAGLRDHGGGAAG